MNDKTSFPSLNSSVIPLGLFLVIVCGCGGAPQTDISEWKRVDVMAPKLLVEIPSEDYTALFEGWSPHGHYFAYTRRVGDNDEVFVYDVSTQKSIRIPAMSKVNFTEFAWSPDEKRLALGTYHEVAMVLDGQVPEYNERVEEYDLLDGSRNRFVGFNDLKGYPFRFEYSDEGVSMLVWVKIPNLPSATEPEDMSSQAMLWDENSHVKSIACDICGDDELGNVVHIARENVIIAEKYRYRRGALPFFLESFVTGNRNSHTYKIQSWQIGSKLKPTIEIEVSLPREGSPLLLYPRPDGTIRYELKASSEYSDDTAYLLKWQIWDHALGSNNDHVVLDMIPLIKSAFATPPESAFLVPNQRNPDVILFSTGSSESREYWYVRVKSPLRFGRFASVGADSGYVEVSPDGTRYAIQESDGKLRLYDISETTGSN